MQIIDITFEIPETCGKCKFYRRNKYQCHNESGWEAFCGMGYMDKNDMRDREFSKSKFEGCKLHEPNQLIKVEEGWSYWENEFNK